MLKKHNIKHMLIEDYFSKNDQNLIDEKTADFTFNWYKNIDKKKTLQIEGLSLGFLLEIEIANYFFLVLKRVIGIIRVIEKEKPKKI